jgi:hypothetical protein
MGRKARPLPVSWQVRQMLVTQTRHFSLGSENDVRSAPPVELIQRALARQRVMPAFANEDVHSLNQRIRVAIRDWQATLRLGACKLIPAAG